MAVYLTGRTFTLNMSGSQAGALHGRIASGAFIEHAWSQWTIGAFYCSAGMTASLGEGFYDYQLIVTAGSASGVTPDSHSDRYSNHLSNTWGPPTNATIDRDLSGTCSVSCDVEECVEIKPCDGIDMSGGILNGQPNYGGTATTDRPPGIMRRYFLRPRVGGTITMTASAGILSLTSTFHVTSLNQSNFGEVPWPVGLQAQTVDGTGYALSTTLTATANGIAVNAPYTHTSSGGEVTVDCAGGCRVSSMANHNGTCTASISPARSYAATGVVRALQDPYPVDLTLRVDRAAGLAAQPITCSGGVWLDSNTQKNFGCGGGWDGGSFPTTNVNEWAPFRVWIDPASLTLKGEDSTLWRCLIRCKTFNALSLTQAASMDAEHTAVPADWTAGAHTTLNPGMAIVVAGGTGSLSTTLPAAAAGLKGTSFSGVSFQGYRYLRLAITADTDGLPVRVTLGTKVWDLTVNNGVGHIDVDLCAPTNNAAITDATDSKWTYASNGPVVITDGPMSGVSNVGTLTLGNLTSGHTYTLTALTLIRKDHAVLTLLPAFNGWVIEFPPVGSGPTTTTRVRRFLLGDTDGRQSREEPDVVWVEITNGATTDTFNDTTLQACVASLNGNSGAYATDGWSSTLLASAPDGSGHEVPDYLNYNGPMLWLQGAGLLYTNAGGWQSGFDLDVTGTLTLLAQDLVDEIDWYPGIGDVLYGSGTTDGVLQVRAGAILRGASTGLVFGANMAPANGVTIQLLQGATLFGTALTQAIGEYQNGAYWSTGHPHGQGLATFDTVAQIGTMPYPKVTRAFVSRKRHRACFGVTSAAPVTASQISLVRDYTSRLFLFLTDASNNLICLSFADDDMMATNITVDAAGNCSTPDYLLNLDVLEGVHLSGTQPKHARSRDHGGTWQLLNIPIPGAWTAGYTAITLADHERRLVALGYHVNDPMNGSDPATDWYCQVGNLQSDGTYTWSTPVALGLGAVKPAGDLQTRNDSVLEFAYLDTGGAPHVLRGYALDLTGHGTWV